MFFAPNAPELPVGIDEKESLPETLNQQAERLLREMVVEIEKQLLSMQGKSQGVEVSATDHDLVCALKFDEGRRTMIETEKSHNKKVVGLTLDIESTNYSAESKKELLRLAGDAIPRIVLDDGWSPLRLRTFDVMSAKIFLDTGGQNPFCKVRLYGTNTKEEGGLERVQQTIEGTVTAPRKFLGLLHYMSRTIAAGGKGVYLPEKMLWDLKGAADIEMVAGGLIDCSKRTRELFEPALRQLLIERSSASG